MGGSAVRKEVNLTAPPRQKKPTTLRFRSFRKRRENCASVVSFFLSDSKLLQELQVVFLHGGQIRYELKNQHEISYFTVNF